MDCAVVIDTNVLLVDADVIDQYEQVIIPITVLEELDDKKNELGELGYKARQAIRKIENSMNVEIDIFDYIPSFEFDTMKKDNHILWCAKTRCARLLTNDVAMKAKAKSVGVVVEEYKVQQENEYKGYKEISGDTEFINSFFDNIEKGINEYGFVENEYLILHNTDLEDTFEYRFTNGKFTDLKLPSSKIIKALNSYQRCALDLLNNKDIPIKIITGNYGSGKTLLSVKMGLYHVFDKGTYSKMFMIRNPIGSGEKIGFLPGDKYEKIQDFLKPFAQYLNRGIDDLNYYIKEGQIVVDVPYFLKGLSIQDSFVIVDEAEDIDIKTLKLIGTRVDKDSAIVFCGDYNQAETKYKNSNGLKYLINKMKGNSLCGVINLPIDVRSEVSKMFAEL